MFLINRLTFGLWNGTANSHISRIATYQQFAKLSQAAAAPSVEKSLLSKLRKQTGYAFSNCRKALALHNNDFDQALEWLNEEAAKEGWAKATKLQNRPMSQGVIGVIANSSRALLVEVNCETDFVARNSKFLELVSNVTNLCFNHLQTNADQKLLLPTDALGALSNVSSETVADIVAKEVGNIGENLKASRAVYMSVGNNNSYLTNYIHTAGLNQNFLEIEGCKFGKYSSVAILNGNVNQPDIALHATQIGQHIVGMNPKSLGEIEQEEEAAVEGTQRSEETPKESDKRRLTEDESRLLYQEFLLDSDIKVKQWLDEREISVTDFARFAVGEDTS